MKRLCAEIEIEAPAERVWQVLTDFRAYGEWNPFMTHVLGEAKLGTRLDVYLESPGWRRLRFKVKVLKAERGRELRWVGTGFRGHIPGLFRGERVITIEPLDPQRVLLAQQTFFTGLLVPALRLDAYQASFEQMNRALKARAEAR